MNRWIRVECGFQPARHAHLREQVAREQVEMVLQLLDPVAEPAIVLEQHTEGMADRRSLFGRQRPVEPLGELRPVRLQSRGQLAGQFDGLVEQVDVGVVVYAPLADRHAAVATDLRAGDALAGVNVLQVHLGAAPRALRLELAEEPRAFLEQLAQFLLFRLWLRLVPVRVRIGRRAGRDSIAHARDEFVCVHHDGLSFPGSW